MSDLPPLPPGFTLDGAAAPPPPPGFTVDEPAPPIPDVIMPTPPVPAPSWPDVGKAALNNLGSSASQFGHDIVQPVLHPIDTAKTVGELGLGIMQKLIPGEQGSEQMADAVGRFFADRYGSVENIKNTLATDPVGALADVSAALTLGGLAVAKAPAAVSKVTSKAADMMPAMPVRNLPAVNLPDIRKPAAAAGATLKDAGQGTASFGNKIDPLALAAGAATKAGKAIGYAGSELIGGLGTHTGGNSLRLAANAGYQGGRVADDFRNNMRGNVPMEDVVQVARNAVSMMRQKRGRQYREQMTAIGRDATPLDMTPIEEALGAVADVGMYKGQRIKPSTTDVWEKITAKVNEWKMLDPAEYHTAEGLDALKQAIGDIRDSTEFHSPSRVVADQAYRAVWETITKQAPDYAKAMKDYETASNLIKEIEQTLSTGRGKSVDTALRKLQSVMRNNANTNYGKRLDLVQALENAGGGNIQEMLAGQSLNTWTPRGLGKAVGSATLAGGIGSLTGPGSQVLSPWLLAALAPQSPRLMGEVAYYTGKAAGAGNKAAQYGPRARFPALGAHQSGRLDNRRRRPLADRLLLPGI